MQSPNIPYRKQETDVFCGPTVVQMIIAKYGHDRSQEELAGILGTDHTGTKIEAIEAFLQSTAFSTDLKRNATFPEIEQAMALGAIVIVGYIETEENKLGHYGIVSESDGDTITLIDPLMGPDISMTREAFESRWHDDADDSYGDHMMMAVYPPAEEHVG